MNSGQIISILVAIVVSAIIVTIGIKCSKCSKVENEEKEFTLDEIINSVTT